MFQKNPICLKKRPICCPYVALSEGFSSPYVEKAPYVANQVPICGPYAAHMRPLSSYRLSETKEIRTLVHYHPATLKKFSPCCLVTMKNFSLS